MDRLLSENSVDAKQLSPLTLAFIGDTVYDLLVREELICKANRPANDLHLLAVKQVKASAQSHAAELILPILTEDELTGADAMPKHRILQKMPQRAITTRQPGLKLFSDIFIFPAIYIE